VRLSGWLKMRSNGLAMFRPVSVGIAFKLFCALLGAGVVMAAAMGIASRISFQQGFLGYLNELETQRLGVLTATLADVYRDRADEMEGSGRSCGAGRTTGARLSVPATAASVPCGTPKAGASQGGGKRAQRRLQRPAR